ncbi:MAG: hypothetical protein ABSA46_00795 [Thermodesulfovibrionales bacterium]
MMPLNSVKVNLKNAGRDGSPLKPKDLLIASISKGEIVKDAPGNTLAVICNVKFIWKKPKEA